MTTPPELPEKKKGKSCLAIGGIGCLVILVVLFLGGGALIAKFAPGLKVALEEFQKDSQSNPDKATAKLGIKMIPNVIIVREDDAAKTITFKATPDAEEMTMHYEGVSTSKVKPRVTNSQGQEVDLSKNSAPAPSPTTGN